MDFPEESAKAAVLEDATRRMELFEDKRAIAVRSAILAALLGDRIQQCVGQALREFISWCPDDKSFNPSNAMPPEKLSICDGALKDIVVRDALLIRLDAFCRDAVIGLVESLTARVFDGDRPYLASMIGDPFRLDIARLATILGGDEKPDWVGEFKLHLVTEKLTCGVTLGLSLSIHELQDELLATAIIDYKLFPLSTVQ